MVEDYLLCVVYCLSFMCFSDSIILFSNTKLLQQQPLCKCFNSNWSNKGMV